MRQKMKTKVKQLTVIIALLLLCTAILPCIYGCTKGNNKIFETDLFRCMYNEDKTGVIILELTEKGQEQEILVIPEEINGLPVVRLGGVTGYPNRQHYLISENVEKIYIKARLKYIADSALPTKRNISVYFIGAIEDLNITTFNFNETMIIIPEKETEYINIFDYHIQQRGVKIKVANIVYYVDENREKIYWIDYLCENEGIIFPPTPIQNKKRFEGWYLEKECVNQWNGQYLDSQKDALELFAKWSSQA